MRKFYSKFSDFFDSNQKTLETNLDDTIDSDEHGWSKKTFKKGVFVWDQREKR